MSTKFSITLLIIVGLIVGLANLYLLRDYWWGENAEQSYAQQAQNLSTFSPPPIMDDIPMDVPMLEADVSDAVDDNRIDANRDNINPTEPEISAPIVDEQPKIVPKPKVQIIENNSKHTDTNTDIRIENNQTHNSQTNNNQISDTEITDNAVIAESKSAFMQRYYSDLKHVPYEQTWAMLSKRFQSKHSLKGYINWWSKNVDTVFLEKIVRIKGDSVTVRLQYKMKNGKQICSQDTFGLVASDNSWLLDTHRYRNCR